MRGDWSRIGARTPAKAHLRQGVIEQMREVLGYHGVSYPPDGPAVGADCEPTIHQLAVLERSGIRVRTGCGSGPRDGKTYFDVDPEMFRLAVYAFDSAPRVPMWLRRLVTRYMPNMVWMKSDIKDYSKNAACLFAICGVGRMTCVDRPLNRLGIRMDDEGPFRFNKLYWMCRGTINVREAADAADIWIGGPPW